MGWPANTCISPTDPTMAQDPAYSEDPDKRRFARLTSLVPATEAASDNRNYAAFDSAGVRTHQIFVRGSADATGAQVQGNTYILRAIESVGFVTLKDVGPTDPPNTDFLVHEIENTALGAATIQELLTNGSTCTY